MRRKGSILESITPFLTLDLEGNSASLPDDLPGCHEGLNHDWNELNDIDADNHWKWQSLREADWISRAIQEGAYDLVAALAIVIHNDFTRFSRDIDVDPNDETIETSCNPIFEDDHEQLKIEAWQYVQTRNWKWINWDNLCHDMRRITIVTTRPSPFIQYAMHILPKLSQDELQRANETFRISLKLSEDKDRMITVPEKSSIGVSYTFLSLRQIILDRCEPIQMAIIPSAYPFPSFFQLPRYSCPPTAIWEWNPITYKIDLISLYDIENDEEITVIPWRKIPDKTSISNNNLKPDHIPEEIRWGHWHFQNNRFEDALACYRNVLQNESNSSQTDDVWHAIGAVFLAQRKFRLAQQHWREAAQSHSRLRKHPGISLQLIKQKAYDYENHEKLNLQPNCKSIHFPAYESFFGRQCFLTKESVVSEEMCTQIIKWAEMQQWTTSRHYAVPTHDVAVHTIPSILQWFNNWMNTTVRPLLEHQFGLSGQYFYCHDAFVVRYESTQLNNYLPVHVDESTHSLVLALNQDFQGGGTYFCDFHTTIVPSQPGCLLTFRGNLLRHGGNAVIHGRRYILAGFLYHDYPPSRKRPIFDSSNPLPNAKTPFSFDFQTESI
jgi:hypothetical protein